MQSCFIPWAWVWFLQLHQRPQLPPTLLFTPGNIKAEANIKQATLPLGRAERSITAASREKISQVYVIVSRFPLVSERIPLFVCFVCLVSDHFLNTYQINLVYDACRIIQSRWLLLVPEHPKILTKILNNSWLIQQIPETVVENEKVSSYPKETSANPPNLQSLRSYC